MISYFNTKAKSLAKSSVVNYIEDLGNIRTIIIKELGEIYSIEDKIEFLNLYMREFSEHKNNHRLNCFRTNCMYMKSFDTANYFVKQEINNLKKQEKIEGLSRNTTVIENFNVSGNSQLFNFGNISGDIHQNLEKLIRSGESEVSEAISSLTKAVEKSNELTQEQIKDHLESLRLLSDEALKEGNERQSKSALKAIIKYGLGSLNAFGSFASLTEITLPVLTKYFLMQ